MKWGFLPFISRSGDIIIILDYEVFELMNSRIGVYSVCCILRSMEDNFCLLSGA